MPEEQKPDPVFKGPRGPLRHRCAAPGCSSVGDHLSVCADCKIVRYCSNDHQLQDRRRHKEHCTKTKHAREELASSATKLQQFRGRDTAAAVSEVAREWRYVPGYGNYMRARHELMGLCKQAQTLDGLQEALGHLEGLLRLTPDDTYGLRFVAPSLMLRLDRDQECYDSINWWANLRIDPWERESRYIQKAILRPLHDILDTPAPGVLMQNPWLNLNYLVALLHLRLKLLIDMRNLVITRKVLSTTALPAELWDLIERAVLRSPLSTKFLRQSPAELKRIERSLREHAVALGRRVVAANVHFMPGWFNAEEVLRKSERWPDNVELYAEMTWGVKNRGSYNEMVWAMKTSFATGWETIGIHELMHAAFSAAARALWEVDVVEDMHVHGREKEYSARRVWDYFDMAFQDYSYLGHFEDRPSVRGRRVVE